jgi:hypothetical protein
MRYLAVVLALAASPALANLSLKGDQFDMQLLRQKCTAPKVLALLTDEWKPKFMQGRLVYEGRPLQMCWAISRPGFVVIVDEDGDAAEIPLSAFKESPNA